MINLKPSFVYIFGLVSLIIAFGMVSREKSAKVELLPSPPPSATPLPKPELFPGAARLARCRALSQPRFFFYTLSLSNYKEDHLLITGTVYASNLTPLSDATIEILQIDPTQANQPDPSPRLLTPIDEAGHYRFTAKKPARPEGSYLHLRFTSQNHCPLLLHLHLVTEASPPPAEPPAFAKTVEVTGPVLQGPLDIVLPVPASGR